MRTPNYITFDKDGLKVLQATFQVGNCIVQLRWPGGETADITVWDQVCWEADEDVTTELLKELKDVRLGSILYDFAMKDEP